MPLILHLQINAKSRLILRAHDLQLVSSASRVNQHIGHGHACRCYRICMLTRNGSDFDPPSLNDMVMLDDVIFVALHISLVHKMRQAIHKINYDATPRRRTNTRRIKQCLTKTCHYLILHCKVCTLLAFVCLTQMKMQCFSLTWLSHSDYILKWITLEHHMIQIIYMQWRYSWHVALCLSYIFFILASDIARVVKD